MSLRTFLTSILRENWILVVLGVGLLVGLVVVLNTCDDPWGRGKAKPAALQLVGGEPRRDAVSVYHDDARGVTCYVTYSHQAIQCFLDITLEDQQRMLVYRDGGR